MNRQADPSYPLSHSGPVLVCGFGPGLFEDLEQARVLFPSAPIIVVNRAARAVKGFAIYTLHAEEMGLFSREQAKRFGSDFTAHTGMTRYNPKKHTYVDYYWKWSASKGSSSWSAAKMAHMMGFDFIVLCGVPLVTGNYADGTLAMPMQHQRIIDVYREFILGDTEIHHKVKSMSGWTKEVFGEPT
jgi:hypothetical protein